MKYSPKHGEKLCAIRYSPPGCVTSRSLPLRNWAPPSLRQPRNYSPARFLLRNRLMLQLSPWTVPWKLCLYSIIRGNKSDNPTTCRQHEWIWMVYNYQRLYIHQKYSKIIPFSHRLRWPWHIAPRGPTISGTSPARRAARPGPPDIIKRRRHVFVGKLRGKFGSGWYSMPSFSK